jgi:hypothetical protein
MAPIKKTADQARMEELRIALSFAEKTAMSLKKLIGQKPPQGGYTWNHAGDAEQLSLAIGDAWAAADIILTHGTSGRKFNAI